MTAMLTDSGETKRTVLFVAHSLGGLILQAYLPTCSSSLRASIHGLIFFGTPNLGLREEDWVEFSAAIDNALNSSSQSSLPTNLHLSRLRFISNEFQTWLPHQSFARKVICFYEVLPVGNVGIVC